MDRTENRVKNNYIHTGILQTDLRGDRNRMTANGDRETFLKTLIAILIVLLVGRNFPSVSGVQPKCPGVDVDFGLDARLYGRSFYGDQRSMVEKFRPIGCYA